MQNIISMAIAAGKREKSAQTMLDTPASLVMVTTASPLTGSDPEMKPAAPSRRVTSAPETARPNFWAIVPEEKMSPVDEVPYYMVE